MKKRFLSLILMGVLFLSATACGGSGTDAGSGTDSGASASQSQESGQESQSGPGAAEDTEQSEPQAQESEEPITLTIANVGSSQPYPNGESAEDNWWTRQYKERFNVDVKTEWYTTDGDSYNTKLNMAIVSKSIPDAFTATSLRQLKELVDADLLLDMTPYFEEYASDLVKSIAKQDPDTFNTGYIDGKMYGVTQMHYGWSSNPYYVWLRSDWMQEQNLEAPKTIDDLVNIMTTFQNAYGGWGLAADKTLYTFKSLALAWGAQPDIWITKEDGTMEPGAIQPEMKEALAAFAKWYEDGLIDPNFTTYDMTAMNNGVIDGSIGVEVFQQWWGYNPGADVVKQNGPEAIFYPYELPKATQDVLYPISYTNRGYTVVSKDCEHPEAVIKLINFYADAFFNPDADEEAKFLLADTTYGDYAHITPFRIQDTTVEDQNLEQVTYAIENNDPDSITLGTASQKYIGAKKWIDDQDPSGLGDYLQHGAGEFAAFRLAINILNEKRYQLNAIWGLTPEEMDTYGSTLDDILTEGFTKIIIGDEDVSYFDELVSNWRTAGGDTVIQAVNEMYKE